MKKPRPPSAAERSLILVLLLLAALAAGCASTQGNASGDADGTTVHGYIEGSYSKQF